MNLIEIYVNNFKYIEGIENADISFVPQLARRRMSALDKVTLAALNGCYEDDIENIIFSSKTGEIERLLKIISQYQEEKETSPALFSGSVHNFAVSSFLLNKQKSIPYTALAAGETSFSSGLLACATSKYTNELFVYSDFDKEFCFSFCLNISKTKKQNSKKFILNIDEKTENKPQIKDFLKLFSGETDTIKTPFCSIERASDD